MSLHFYCENEDNVKEESIDHYKDLFLEISGNPPNLERLKEALNQIFISGGVSEKEVNEYTNDLINNSKEVVDKRKFQINEKYPNISYDESLIISSYTCEAKQSKFSPYKILNRNLVRENRKEGLKKIYKYFFLLLMTLRKLPRYYPSNKQKYLYRCIDTKVDILIDPFNPNKVPYIRDNFKTFWAFTSTSPKVKKTFTFLGDKGYFENRNFKSGTIFSLYGSVWGYDITLFNYYNEEEILLEPERKFYIENVIPDANDFIINVTCEIKDTPIVLNNFNKYNYDLNNLCKAKMTDEDSHSNYKIYKTMIGYPFVTHCPSCPKNSNFIWLHANDNGLQTIDDERKIHCQNCGLNKFLMELKFDCGNHKNEYLSPNWRRSIFMLSQLSSQNEKRTPNQIALPDEILEKIYSKIMLSKK